VRDAPKRQLAENDKHILKAYKVIRSTNIIMSFIDATEAPPSHAILYLYIEDCNLRYLYEPKVVQYNIDSLNDAYPNAGFDLYFPQTVTAVGLPTTMVSMGVVAEMRIYDSIKNEWTPTGYYMYPRSSISKTPLMLANSTGVIDSGYRGPLIGAFRNLSGGEAYQIRQGDRLLQICAPDLRPMVVKIVERSFFEETSRASGGFGSTGV
jgi:dUTP pyrophosphatase